MNQKNLYKSAGVDVEKGDKLVDWLQNTGSKVTGNDLGEVVSGIGGFASMFRPNFKGMKDPLLVSATDGVGTKVLLGMKTDILEGVGIDLVAMCVNDLYTLGGRPLFFLDYFATGGLEDDQFKRVLSGIREGCSQCSTILMGGETAEMPGLYEKGHFDLAGFVVGVVDGERVLGPKRVKVGDELFSIESSGFHSNGYSLIRKWVEASNPDDKMLKHLMTPTKIYAEIPKIYERVGDDLHALANITGGGISGNLPRVMPGGVVCSIEKSEIPVLSWMKDFISQNSATPDDVEGVFNLGAGMIAAVSKGSDFSKVAKDEGLTVKLIGEIQPGEGKPQVVYR